jgi:formate C-acetyltransferase
VEATAARPKSEKHISCWRGFQPGAWMTSIDVRDFINRNATPYFGDERFLAGASKRTEAVWKKLQPYFKEERERREFSR